MVKIIQQKLQCLKQLCQPRISKHLHESGGVRRDYVNTFILLGIAIFNVINITLGDRSIINEWLVIFPFIVFSILVYVNKTSKVTKSIIFMGIGIAYQMSVPDQSYLGATSFFIISFLQHVNYKHGLILVFVSLITVVIKSTQSNATPSQTVLAIMAFGFIYINIFKVVSEYKRKFQELKDKHKQEIENQKMIHDKEVSTLNEYNFSLKNKIEQLSKEIEDLKKNPPEKLKNIDLINITGEEKGMLKLFCRGVTYEKISQFMGLNNAHDTVRRKITGLRNKYKKKTDAEFVKWLYDSV